MVKVAAWKKVGVSEAATAMTTAFRPSLAAVVENCGVMYTSTDMKTGISNEEMMPIMPWVRAGLEMDPRGAYFDQATVLASVKQLYTTDPVTHAKMQVAVGKRAFKDLEGLMKADAYGYRVICSHIRIRMDQRLLSIAEGKPIVPKIHPPVFIALYNMFSSTHQVAASTSSIRHPNPCPYFANGGGDCDLDEMEALADHIRGCMVKDEIIENTSGASVAEVPALADVAIAVGASGNGSDDDPGDVGDDADAAKDAITTVGRVVTPHGIAEQTMSDGTHMKAIKYEKGSEGFIVAYFDGHAGVLGSDPYETDFPNTRLKSTGDGILCDERKHIPKEAAKPKAKGGPTAAAAKAAAAQAAAALKRPTATRPAKAIEHVEFESVKATCNKKQCVFEVRRRGPSKVTCLVAKYDGSPSAGAQMWQITDAEMAGLSGEHVHLVEMAGRILVCVAKGLASEGTLTHRTLRRQYVAEEITLVSASVAEQEG